jgi:hypothetical protein
MIINITNYSESKNNQIIDELTMGDITYDKNFQFNFPSNDHFCVSDCKRNNVKDIFLTVKIVYFNLLPEEIQTFIIVQTSFVNRQVSHSWQKILDKKEYERTEPLIPSDVFLKNYLINIKEDQIQENEPFFVCYNLANNLPNCVTGLKISERRNIRRPVGVGFCYRYFGKNLSITGMRYCESLDVVKSEILSEIEHIKFYPGLQILKDYVSSHPFSSDYIFFEKQFDMSRMYYGESLFFEYEKCGNKHYDKSYFVDLYVWDNHITNPFKK